VKAMQLEKKSICLTYISCNASQCKNFRAKLKIDTISGQNSQMPVYTPDRVKYWAIRYKNDYKRD